MKPLWLTGYSTTHSPLFLQHFKPSFDKYLAHHFELHVRKIEGNPGKFGEASFNDWGRREMGAVLGLLKKNMGRIVVSTGADFHFYEDFFPQLKPLLHYKELVGIYDMYQMICGDFAAFVVTDKILNLYQWMIDNDARFPNQQFTFNAGIKTLKIDAAVLSGDFYTVGMSTSGQVWNPGEPVDPPSTIALHHGNFTVGAENKLALLDAVEARVLEYAAEPAVAVA